MLLPALIWGSLSNSSRNSLVSVIGPTIVGPGGHIFRIKVLRRLENAMLILVFANAVLYKMPSLLLFCNQISQKVCCTFLRF